MTAVTWKDNTFVTFLTALPGNTREMTTCQRRGKDSKGNFVSLTVAQPMVAQNFNEFMGGVDRQYEHLYFITNALIHK